MTHVLNEDQMCLDCIFPKYTVGFGYIEPAAQLKTLKLVPYRKYLGNTISRVSKLATFFIMVNSQSAESLLSGLHTNCPISITSHHIVCFCCCSSNNTHREK